MNATILFPGKKLKGPESIWVEEYLKRLSRYGQFSLTTLAEPKEKLALAAIEPTLKKFPFLISLDVKGKALSTEAFAAFLDKHRQHKMTFLIGASYGLSSDILQHSSEVLSLSALTLPHRLALVLLTEQLYRCTSFLQGHPYHHQD